VGFSLKGSEEAGGLGAWRGSAASRSSRKAAPASPFREARSSFASFTPAGKEAIRTAIPAVSSFPFNASVAFLPASSLSSARTTRFAPSRFKVSRCSAVKPFVPQIGIAVATPAWWKDSASITDSVRTTSGESRAA